MQFTESFTPRQTTEAKEELAKVDRIKERKEGKKSEKMTQEATPVLKKRMTKGECVLTAPRVLN